MNKNNKVFIGIGSNQGNKLNNIYIALDFIKNEIAIKPIITSFLYCSEAKYVINQPCFLNAVIEIITNVPPIDLLIKLKEIEKKVGRLETYRWGPRVIDLDILFYNNDMYNYSLEEGTLIIPHERLHERSFVLKPLLDIASDYIHPIKKLKIKNLYDELLKSEKETCQRILPILPTNNNNINEMSHYWFTEKRTYIMGILNTTPDSFSEYDHSKNYIEKVKSMISNGADIIDIGGESTRPGADPVSVDEELLRVIPIIKKIRTFSNIPISIDTTKSKVAEEAIKNGATIINDISGASADENMLRVASKYNTPIILMHSRGTPKTMVNLKNYIEDNSDDNHKNINEYEKVLNVITNELDERINNGMSQIHHDIDKRKHGTIYRWNIIIDPGIGFAKDKNINLILLKDLDMFIKKCGYFPTLVGVSRKNFIGQICNPTNISFKNIKKERKYGTLAANCAAISGGATILRVHDVYETKQIVLMMDAIYKT